MNASPIPKITSWLKFLGKNLYLVSCATVCGESKVMLVTMYSKFTEMPQILWVAFSMFLIGLLSNLYATRHQFGGDEII